MPDWTDLSREDILHFLRSSDEKELETLWNEADAVRKRFVGDAGNPGKDQRCGNGQKTGIDLADKCQHDHSHKY